MSHALLLTADELPLYGLSADFLDGFEPYELAAQLQSVTDEALGRMQPAIVGPLSSWGADLKGAVGRIVAYELKSLRGLGSTSVSVGDENLLVRAQQARAWLDDVGAGKITPQDIVDSSDDGEAGDSGYSITSDDQRGW